MNWTFIVIRDNIVEKVKSFNDFWDGADYADDFIKSIDSTVQDLPAYNRNEFYKKDNLTVGLYKG